MNEIQIFNNPDFGEIRTITINGEPWFVGNDVAKPLGYSSPKNAVAKFVDDEDKQKHQFDSSGQNREMVIISESGLYSLIFGSKLESAKRFKKWVTSEVLPSIRKTGNYGQPKLPENPMELLELHYQALKEVDKKVDNLEDRFNKLESDMPVFNIDAKRIQDAVKKKAIEILGGKESNAYKGKSIRTYVFADIQCMLRRNFGVKRYEEIKHRQTDDALRLIEEHKPPLVLKDRVDMMNAQQTLNFGKGGAAI